MLEPLPLLRIPWIPAPSGERILANLLDAQAGKRKSSDGNFEWLWSGMAVRRPSLAVLLIGGKHIASWAPPQWLHRSSPRSSVADVQRSGPIRLVMLIIFPGSKTSTFVLLTRRLH